VEKSGVGIGGRAKLFPCVREREERQEVKTPSLSLQSEKESECHRRSWRPILPQRTREGWGNHIQDLE
jgi:hypothetical protein